MLDFYNCVQYIFLGFLNFFLRIRNQHQNMRFMIPAQDFRIRNGPKNEKGILLICLRILFYIHFWDGRLHVVKKVKIVVPYSTMYNAKHLRPIDLTLTLGRPISFSLSLLCV
jgi:hypothetical protein